MSYVTNLAQVPARGLASPAAAIATAAAFTAASTQYADVASNASLVANGDFSIAFWMWANSLDAAYHRLVTKGDGTNGGSEWIVQIDPTGATGAVPGIDLAVSDGNLSVPSKYSTPLTAGAWHFVCGTFKNSDGTQLIAVDNGAANGGAQPRHPIQTTASPFVVASSSAHDLPFDGRIDALGFWKRVLTGGEQTTLWNGGAGLAFAGVTGTLLTGLSAWYDFSNNWLDAQGGNTLVPHNGATFAAGKT